MQVLKPNNITELVTALKNGAVLVLPTDTIYGLVCDASKEKAVEKIFEIKKRNREKPLPVFVRDIEMAKQYAEINEKQEQFLKENWPGAVTVVLKTKAGLSPLVYKNGTIALRQPDYKLVLDMLKLFGKPLAQTSANISGLETPNKIEEIIKQFENQSVQPDIMIGGGELPMRKPSKIVDLTEEGRKVLRY